MRRLLLATAMLLMMTVAVEAANIKLLLHGTGVKDGVAMHIDDEVVRHPFTDIAACESWKWSQEMLNLTLQFVMLGDKAGVEDIVVHLTCTDEEGA